jgi:hypothetical protein
VKRDNYIGAVSLIDEDEQYEPLPREQWRHEITLDGNFTVAELRMIILRLEAEDNRIKAS